MTIENVKHLVICFWFKIIADSLQINVIDKEKKCYKIFVGYSLLVFIVKNNDKKKIK